MQKSKTKKSQDYERLKLFGNIFQTYNKNTLKCRVSQVKRNRDRFPEDFMFQLTEEEKSQVVANCGHLSNLKFSKALPYAFTEHGALMAASQAERYVLESSNKVNI